MLGREILKVPALRYIAYENALYYAGLGDLIWTYSTGGSFTPIGLGLLGITCGTAEAHNLLYIAALIP